MFSEGEPQARAWFEAMVAYSASSKVDSTYQLLHRDRTRVMSECIELVLWTYCVCSTTDAWILLLQ